MPAAGKDERRKVDRRAGSHRPPCIPLEEHLALERAVLAELGEIKTQLTDMHSMLTVFRNTRGFVTVLRYLGMCVVGLTAVGGALVAIGAAVKVWVRG